MSSKLATTSDRERVLAIESVAEAVKHQKEAILHANSLDQEHAADAGVTSALRDRLTLDDARIEKMCEGARAVAAQPDPVGRVIASWDRPNGLEISKITVPIGVVAVIYEARPNVTVDVASLCLRSANACILRGSSHALNTNRVLVDTIQGAVMDQGLSRECVQLVGDVGRESARELMQMKGLVDLLVPRGGRGLIKSVEEEATVPYIIDGDGNCHLYVDAAADLRMATDILVNAKVSRPGVCNAVETLLVHRDLQASWLNGALQELVDRGVEIRGDEATRTVFPGALPAHDEDWETEFLDLIIAVKVVDSLDQAISHIRRYGTSNAEAIVTSDPISADRFTAEVDAGCVLVNASTRFSDGSEFGFGSEIGISTQRLHARGPMGPNELTTYKYVVHGDGQTRT